MTEKEGKMSFPRKQDVIPIETRCHSRASGNPEKEKKRFVSSMDSRLRGNDRKEGMIKDWIPATRFRGHKYLLPRAQAPRE